MLYQKKVWIDRQSEHPNRRKLIKVPGAPDTYDVQREEGLVLENGDAYDQTNMNDLERRIAESVDASAIYTATFRLDAWQGTTGKWEQVAACQGMRAEWTTEAPQVKTVGNFYADQELRGVLDLLNSGRLQMLNGQVKAIIFNGTAPSCDIQIFLRRADV